MKKFLYKIKAKFLTIFGDIRISKYPPFLFYDDISYEMTGEHIRQAISVCKPGDIVLRGYDSYLDSFFIASSRSYSHAGVVVDNGKIIHSISPKVTKTDLIDFMQCDRIVVLRPCKHTASAVAKAEKYLKDDTPYDFGFTHGSESLYCFELAACCYPKLQIEKLTASILFGLIKKKEPVYLSDSFFNSKDLKIVFEYNPKYNIDYIKD